MELDNVIGLGVRQVDATPPQVWLAAGRSRNPSGSLAELKQVGVPEVAFGTEAPTVVWNFENCSTDRELAVKETYELRKNHSHNELLQLFDPQQPGLDASEIRRRLRMRAALTGRYIGSGSAIDFQPAPADGRGVKMIPLTLTSRTWLDMAHLLLQWHSIGIRLTGPATAMVAWLQVSPICSCGMTPMLLRWTLRPRRSRRCCGQS